MEELLAVMLLCKLSWMSGLGGCLELTMLMWNSQCEFLEYLMTSVHCLCLKKGGVGASWFYWINIPQIRPKHATALSSGCTKRNLKAV